MKFKEKYFHCGDFLQNSLKSQIDEVYQCVSNIRWEPDFNFDPNNGKALQHQRAYNKAFEQEFFNFDWEQQPVLLKNPRLIGGFRKGLVFLEIQFGNSATLYRDYYKFQYGHANGLLSLAVLIVPTNPSEFFPTRPSSVINMAEFDLAMGLITIDDSFDLRVSEKAHGTDFFDNMVLKFNGQQLRNPIRKSYYPKNEYLDWHVSEVFHGPMREK